MVWDVDELCLLANAGASCKSSLNFQGAVRDDVGWCDWKNCAARRGDVCNNAEW